MDLIHRITLPKPRDSIYRDQGLRLATAVAGLGHAPPDSVHVGESLVALGSRALREDRGREQSLSLLATRFEGLMHARELAQRFSGTPKTYIMEMIDHGLAITAPKKERIFLSGTFTPNVSHPYWTKDSLAIAHNIKTSSARFQVSGVDDFASESARTLAQRRAEFVRDWFEAEIGRSHMAKKSAYVENATLILPAPGVDKEKIQFPELGVDIEIQGESCSVIDTEHGLCSVATALDPVFRRDFDASADHEGIHGHELTL